VRGKSENRIGAAKAALMLWAWNPKEHFYRYLQWPNGLECPKRG